MKFRCQPVEQDFLAIAPIYIENTINLNTSRENVFAILADTSTWPKWFPDMTSAEWMDEPNAGVNRITKMGAMQFTEHFLLWQPPHSIVYRVDDTSFPYADKIIEKFSLVETPDGVKLTHFVGLKLHKVLAPFGRFIEPTIRDVFKKVVLNLGQYIERECCEK